MVVEREGWRWSIEDISFSYAIRREDDGQLRVVSRGRQTRGTPQERAANPQYVNEEAYEELRKQVFPWRLPFDLWVEETRAYLEHLGARRHEVMETFGAGTRPELLADAAVASERLGLSTFEAGIITGEVTGQPGGATLGPWNLWGFGREALDGGNRIPDPANSTAWISAGNWLEVLAGRVDVFLQQSGLKYADLLELLGSYAANPPVEDGRAITIKPSDEGAPDTCELDRLFLDGLDDSEEVPDDPGEMPNISEEGPNGSGNEVTDDSGGALVSLIARFLRLWLKLGWSMRDLDRAFTAFGATAPDDAFLTRLSHVERLREELHLPVDRLLGFWAPIDTAVYLDQGDEGPAVSPSLYDRLFRDRAVINPPDPAFTEDPEQLDGKLTEHVAAITAALGIKAADLSMLFEGVIPDDTLTLDNLSRLHRHATLARALRVPVRDYLGLVRVLGDPFSASASLDGLPASVTGFPIDLEGKISYDEDAGELRFFGVMAEPARDALLALSSDSADPHHDAYTSAVRELYGTFGSANTVRFVERVEKIRTSGFDVDEVGYLLVHDAVAAQRKGPRDEEISLFLEDLRAGLLDVTAGNAIPEADPNGEVTGQKLVLLDWDGATIEELVSTLNDAVIYRTPLPALPGNVELPNDPDTYEVSLASLPQQFEFPAGVEGVISYDQTAGMLRASRLLSAPEREILRNASSDQAYENAVEVLLELQDEMRGTVSYEAESHELRFLGAMTTKRREKLDSLSAANDYRRAVEKLFDAPRRFVSRNLWAFDPEHSTPLAGLPAAVTAFPEDLEDKASYDASAGELRFLGAMSQDERDALLALSHDPNDPDHDAYVGAVRELYGASEAAERFLEVSEEDDVDLVWLFDDEPRSPAERFGLVLQSLMPYLGNRLSESLVEQRVAEAMQLEMRVAERLLTVWLGSPAERMITTFLDPDFAESASSIPVTRDVFGAQFDAFVLLHKVSLLVSKLGLTHEMLGWIFGPDVGWLDPNDLPVAPAARSSARTSSAGSGCWISRN